MADNPKRKAKATEHNDKLIDIAYAEAVKVCAIAEGFAHGDHDWSLPSREEFRRIVRAARTEHYRKANTGGPDDGQ